MNRALDICGTSSIPIYVKVLEEEKVEEEKFLKKQWLKFKFDEEY